MWGNRLVILAQVAALSVLLLASFAAAAGAQGQAEAAGTPDWVGERLDQMFTPTVLVFVGALTAWLFGLVGGLGSAQGWFEKYGYRPPRWLLMGVDGFMFVVLGTLIGLVIYDPTNQVEGFAAGVTWPAGLAAFKGVQASGQGHSAPAPQPGSEKGGSVG